MTEIEEIPLEPHEPSENTQEIAADIPENPEEIQPAPKKRGKPLGAKSKPKPKPEPKPASRGLRPQAKPKVSVEILQTCFCDNLTHRCDMIF